MYRHAATVTPRLGPGIMVRFGTPTRHFIGADNIMWASDYPHTVSTWPHSQEVVARDFQGVPEKEKWQMVRNNAIALYSLDLN